MVGISSDGAPTPIVCKQIGDKLLVLDGQHRLTACFYLGYKVPYTLLKKNLPKGIDDNTYIRHLNTGQRNWTGLDYQKSAINNGTVIYKMINDLGSKHTGLDKQSATRVHFNNSKIDFKFLNKCDDIDELIIEQDISYVDMKVNAGRFSGLLSTISSIFNNDVMIFVEGFTNFVLSVDKGVRNPKLNDFIDFLSIHVDEYEWDVQNLPPQKTPDWTAFFDTGWRAFKKKL